MIDLNSPGWDSDVKVVLQDGYLDPGTSCVSVRFSRFLIGHKQWKLLPDNQVLQVIVDSDGETTVRKFNEHYAKGPNSNSLLIEPVSELRLNHYSDLTLDTLLQIHPIEPEATLQNWPLFDLRIERLSFWKWFKELFGIIRPR